MKKTVLFAGKEYPAGSALASAAVNHNRNVVITVPAMVDEIKDSLETAGTTAATWNKSSSVSARSVILHAENAYQHVDEAILNFDTSWFAPNFKDMTPEICSKAIDSMISSYLYLTMEVISRFSKTEGGTIVFMLKTAPGHADMVNSTSIKSENSNFPVGILPSTAESAFKALAESIAAKYAEKNGIKVFLVKADHDTPDSHFAGWMFEYLDAIYVAKAKNDPRHAIQWVKVGSKPQIGFSLFRK